MKSASLSLVCALAFFGGACEKHPLPGEPPIADEDHGGNAGHSTGEQHTGGKVPAAGEGRDENAQPAAKSGEPGGGKPAEAPKFFPKASK